MLSPICLRVETPAVHRAAAQPSQPAREIDVFTASEAAPVAESGAFAPDGGQTAAAVAGDLVPGPAGVALRVLVMGPPGGGKSTQGEILAREHGVPHVSTGALLRREVERGTEIGKIVGPLIEDGKMAPKELVYQVLKARLEEADAQRGFILDGFPRQPDQISMFEDLRRELDLGRVKAIAIQVDDDEVRRRLLSRGRADDTPEVVDHRLQVYKDTTIPVIEHFRALGDLIEVDGNGDIEATAARVKEALP